MSDTLYCAAQFTRVGSDCEYVACFLVGIPGDVSTWRASCAQHLAKVVRDRVDKVSANRSVAVHAINQKEVKA